MKHNTSWANTDFNWKNGTSDNAEVQITFPSTSTGTSIDFTGGRSSLYKSTEITSGDSAKPNNPESSAKQHVLDELNSVINRLDPRRDRPKPTSYDPIDLAFRITEALTSLVSIQNEITYRL